VWAGRVIGAVVQACEKHTPRAASASSVGVSTASDSKPTLSARVVSNVTRRTEGRGTSTSAGGCDRSGEHEAKARATRRKVKLAAALLNIRG